MEGNDMQTHAPEIIKVERRQVSCDGGPIGHPKVYLEIGNSGEVTCPYCGRRFVLKAKAAQS